MVIYADMSTGRTLREPSAEYSDEVLFANWLPQLELRLALQEAMPMNPKRCEPPDVEAFMRAVYLSQE